ncbi:MAG: putative lipoprotein YmbA [Planctomycetota bacterium]
MKQSQTLCAFVCATLLSACISKESVEAVHYFRPELTQLELQTAQVQKPLRIETVTAPVEIGSRILWRISSTELVPDENNLWARRPEELLDERLRDLLFGGSFYSSRSAVDPALRVRLVRLEGDMSGALEASVELIVTLRTSDAGDQRARITAREPLSSKNAEGLAAAMGLALSEAASLTETWVLAQK